MSRVPRASLCITLLDDEDYRVLMASKGGLEAFGLFVAMIVVGRERLQQRQARQLSGTESLRFDNSTTHVLAMAHATAKQLNRSLSVLKTVAEETACKPWMYLDETNHLVIRSFFKFNTSTGWGGNREGSGRPPKKNQVDSSVNHLDSESKSSRIPSGSGSGSGSGSTPNGDTHAGAMTDDEPDHDGHGSYLEAARVARELFGETAAKAIVQGREGIKDKILGTDDLPRWDYYVEALCHADAYRKGPRAKKIHTLNGFCIDRVREWVVLGYVPAPVEVETVSDEAPAPAPWKLAETF